MNEQQRFTEQEGAVARYDYGDEIVLVADIGSGAEASVDVVDRTAVIVTDSDQYEFDVPEGEAQAFIKNGVVTIEVER